MRDEPPGEQMAEVEAQTWAIMGFVWEAALFSRSGVVCLK